MYVSCMCIASQRDLTVYVNKQALVADLLNEAAKELQVRPCLATFAFIRSYVANALLPVSQCIEAVTRGLLWYSGTSLKRIL